MLTLKYLQSKQLYNFSLFLDKYRANLPFERKRAISFIYKRIINRINIYVCVYETVTKIVLLYLMHIRY